MDGSAAQHTNDLLPNRLPVGVERIQDLNRDAVVHARDPEEDVLGADVPVTERERFLERELEYLFRARGKGDLAGDERLVAGSDDAHELRARFLERDPEALEYPSADALLLPEHAEQKVFRADVVVFELASL